MKKLIVTLCILHLYIAPLFSQEAVVKGRIVDTNSSDILPDVEVRIQSSIYTTQTDGNGLFEISGTELPQGKQVLVVSKEGYIIQRILITVQNNTTINLDPILLEVDLTEVEAQIGIISLSDNELDQDEGTTYTVSGLLQASRDVFLNAASFDFSATFFRPRGLDNANGKVLINGIEMNKQFNGRPQWSNWGGLNDVQRNREFSSGLKANDYAFGDIAGTSNIIMRASQYRQGGRISFAAANRSYQGRIMGSYSSGLSLNGWAYTVLLSRRFGNEGYIDGSLYDANAFFGSVEKKINDEHSLNFSAFYTPNRRGRSTAITQEVRDLKGIRYNPNWGYQDGKMRNSRIREIEEPVFMLNHYWTIGAQTKLNTNLSFQTGTTGNSRIDNGGTRLIEGLPVPIGGARNPFGNYYQRLPSYFLQDPNPTAAEYRNAYIAQQEFQADGQLDWNALYFGNTNATHVANGGKSTYIIQEDRNDDTQITVNSILSIKLSENSTLNGSLTYRTLHSENFASVKDLLGGTGYLDVDFFAEGENTNVIGTISQSDLQNPNRIVREGDRYKYNYGLDATVVSGFVQGQFKYRVIDLYLSAMASQTKHQRTGLFENGNYPGNRSLGESDEVSFSNYGVKAGVVYKFSGRHLIDANAGYFTKAPTLRNTFSNARQNNDIVIGLENETVQSADISYIYRSPIVKARLTGFYNAMNGQSDINFFFTESAQGFEEGNAFVQEIITNIETRGVGGELGIEAQVTPTIKLKAAASVGQYIFANNPKLYLTSDDFEGRLTFGDGTTKLKNVHVAGGPERAYQLGFEYRDPAFWWVGATTNYFSNAYIDISSLRRSDAFALDVDGQLLNEYDQDIASGLLKQEQFDDYFLVNAVGGKSWKIRKYYVGFFATINNILDQNYKTGGFEDSRNADYTSVLEESKREHPVFGSRYYFGNGTSYYINVYVRF